MSDWIASEIALGFASVVLGMLAGRVCAWGACYLPAHLERQWQRDARELLGLDIQRPNDLQAARASSREIWIAQISCAAFSFMVTLNFGPTMQTVCALLFTWLLLTLSLIDSEHHLLPDALVIPGLWAGITLNSFGLFATLQDALWGCVAGYLSLWSVSQLARLITGRVSMGMGDLKLLAMIGAWGGWQVLPGTVAGSLMIAVILTVYLRLIEGITSGASMPFGPPLSLAGWMIFLASANSSY